MRTCFKTTMGGFEIKLQQQARNRFSVTYGQQFNCDLDYGQAAKELGRAIMHASALEGKLDNG